MHRPTISGSRIGSLLLMLGLSAGLACGNAGADSPTVEGSASEGPASESPASESKDAPATMKELTLAVSGMT